MSLTTAEVQLPGWMDAYLALAWSLIPVRHHLHASSCEKDCKQDKQPLISWKQYQTEQPSRKQIADWLNHHPGCGWAVVTGEVSNNLAVLDFDSRSNYASFYGDTSRIEKETPVAESSRGNHVYVRTIRPVRSFKVEGLVDVSANGHYVKLPPSFHGSGVQYRWINHVGEPVLISNLEQAVWDRAEKLGYKKKRVKDVAAPGSVKGSGYVPNCVATLSQGVKAGARNDSAIHLASYWLNIREINVDDARAWLRDWNKKNDPPLEERELEQVVESAVRGRYTYGCCVSSSDAGNRPHEAAEYVLSEMRLKTLRDTREILYWNSTWHFGAETRIEQLVQDRFHAAQLDDRVTTHFVNEVVGRVRRSTYIDREQFNADPNLLVVKNCVLDLRDFTAKPHSPEHLVIGELPVEYRPDAKSELWLQFLDQILLADQKPAVQEFCGHILEDNYKLQQLMALIGEGSNGKDTFCRVLIRLLGPENFSSRSLQELDTDRFAKSDLYSRKANICSDVPEVMLRSTAVIKSLTGEGYVTAQNKNQRAFQFQNHAKLLQSLNKLPKTTDDTHAFWRRLFIVFFRHTFSDDPELACKECGIHHAKDPNIVERLSTSSELSGVLNWMLEGVKRLRAQNYQLSNSKTAEAVRQDYTRNSDTIKAFLDDCCAQDPEHTVAKDLIYSAYKNYCQQHRLVVEAHNDFCSQLPKRSEYQIRSARPRIGGDRVPSFKGVWVRDPYNWGSELDEDEKPLVEQSRLGSGRMGKGGPLGTPGPEMQVEASLVPSVPGGPGNLHPKDLCWKCWKRKNYEGLAQVQNLGSPRETSCEDCGGPSELCAGIPS